MLHQAVPSAKTIAMLANPSNPMTDVLMAEAQTAARTLGIDLLVVNARSQDEITSAFTTLTNQRIGALLVNVDTLYIAQMNQLVTLAAYTNIPTSYPFRFFPAAGGLMSFGPSVSDITRQSGVYAGRILNGEHPANLPVQQPTKFEMVINLKTAKVLGLAVPQSILLRADEVIE
jgi:putative tryptophan/tyrosine transport system substrate-binding protein